MIVEIHGSWVRIFLTFLRHGSNKLDTFVFVNGKYCQVHLNHAKLRNAALLGKARTITSHVYVRLYTGAVP